eukprot:UN00906
MSLDKMQGWFVEVNDKLWPGHAMALQVDEMLHDGKSDYQHVQVFKNSKFGTVLVIDGCIQTTDLDECAYQEPIAHIPLFAHPNPKRVLVVGGGDAAVITQIVKHECVEEVVICEIDQMVIDCAHKFFPQFAKTYSHPKVTLNTGDAAEYIKNHTDYFDVIIADLSDPDGPAEELFKFPFYINLYKALRAGGKIASQGECIWKDMDLITGLMSDLKKNIPFEAVEYATTQIPTYPMGQMGFILCSKPLDEANPNTSYTMRKLGREIPADFDTKYYDAEMHDAAFVLPVFAKKAIKAALEKQ